MSPNRRRTTVIILIVLTIVLGAVAVGISYYIQQNQSPDDSSANAVNCNQLSTSCTSSSSSLSGGVLCYDNPELPASTKKCCPSGQRNNNGTCINASLTSCVGYGGQCQGGCNFGQDTLAGTDCEASNTVCCKSNSSTVSSCSSRGGTCASSCASGATSYVGTDCTVNGSSVLCCVGGSTGGGAKTALSDCTSTCNDSDGCTCPTSISCNAGSGASIANGVTCGGNAASGSGSCSSGDCFTGIANCGSVGRQINSGSCSVNGTAGICCAFDGQQGGGSTPTPSKAQCGSSCNSTADCAGSSAGYAVTCRNGTCQNASCAEGKTVAGANCECSSLNACGQPCSASLGLCQTGSSCGFIGATSSCLSNSDKNNGTQYCLPNSPYKNYTLTTCSSIAASNLRAPGGANVTSQAQVIEACTAPVSTITAVCGDGVCSGTESSVSCPNDCRLPDTAIFSDRIDRIILGIVVILLGISLAGGFDKFRKYKK